MSISSTALTSSNGLNTTMAPVHFLLFVVLSPIALKIVLFFTLIYISGHIYFYFLIENCPKLRTWDPNYGPVDIC